MRNIKPSSWDMAYKRQAQMASMFSDPDTKAACERAAKFAMNRYLIARTRERAARDAREIALFNSPNWLSLV